MILRCTSKLLAVIGPNRIEDHPPAEDSADWYANLLWHDRRKCLLLTHAATLFTAMQAAVSTAELRSTRRLVLGLIERELVNEGLPLNAFGDLRTEPVHLAKTADRSVVGCMQDMASYWRAAVAQHGGLLHTDLAAVNRSLRRNINSARGYQRPIDLIVKQLDTRHS